MNLPEQLKKAVKEYYEWLGDRNARPIKFVTCKNGLKPTLLLARFIDEDGRWMSSLMTETHWADGHHDVTEIYYCCRKLESAMVEAFENSPNGELGNIDDDYDETEDYDDGYNIEDEEDDYGDEYGD